MECTSIDAGQQANLIQISVVPVPGPLGLTLAVSESDFGQFLITVTVGYDLLTGQLNVANWQAVADAMNSDAAIAALVFSVGSVGTSVVSISNIGPLTGGTAGGGEGSYFFSLDAPPPPPVVEGANTTAQNDGGGGLNRCPAGTGGRRSFAPWRPKKRC